MNVEIENRDNDVVCNKCGGLMKRIIASPKSSKLIGIKGAMKRDNVGYFVDEMGNVCEPLTRGHATKKVL